MPRNYEIDMCHGPLLRKMCLFAIPLMCSTTLQLLFNATDVIVVGRFAGDNSLAAVGSNSSIINLMLNFFVGLSIGSNVLAARYYGAHNQEDLSKTVHTTMLLSLLCGIVMTIAGVAGARQILIWMQTPKQVLDLAVKYLRIYFMGITFTIVYNFGSAILRAVGDTRRPLWYLTIAGFINVILNLIFVINFKWDVAGVAAATVISQAVACIFIIICMTRDQGSVHLDFARLHLHSIQLGLIFRLGVPAGFQGMLFSISNVVIQSSVNTFGNVVMAGNAAAMNIEHFVYFAMNSFYQAAISFTSQNLGAGNFKRILRILGLAQVCVMVTGLIAGGAAYIFASPLIGIYSRSTDVIAAGTVRLGIVCKTYLLCGIMDVFVGSLRGLGYAMIPMVVSLAGACLFRLIWVATIFQIPRFHTVQILYLSYPISWVLTFIVLGICFVWAFRRTVLHRRITEKTSLSSGSSLK
ncbi:MAG: MATE family efflux transporter [Spirochaetia bacterium]|nr:MATE family efflux transporter [Spirochaetia bacterium]